MPFSWLLLLGGFPFVLGGRIYCLAVKIIYRENNKLYCTESKLAFQRLFTLRKEDPSTKQILEGGTTLRSVNLYKFRFQCVVPKYIQ